MSEIEKKVISITAEQLGKKSEEIFPVTSLVYDLDMEELDKIELVMALEDEFGIEIPDEDFEKIINVQGIIDYITEKKEEKK